MNNYQLRTMNYELPTTCYANRLYSPACQTIMTRELIRITAIVALHLSRVLYKSTLFMQNKPNFRKAKMNASSAITMNYEQLTMNYANKNKPNSNPIAERAKLMQSVYLQRIMKKNAAKGYEKTKPKQTQFQYKKAGQKLNCRYNNIAK